MTTHTHAHTNQMVERAVLRTGQKQIGYGEKRPIMTLGHVTSGYEIAGSGLRWTDGYYAVRFELDGATHGQRFAPTNEGRTKAEALFEKWDVS